MLTIELFSSGKELPNDPNDEIEKQLTPSGFGSNGNPDTTVQTSVIETDTLIQDEEYEVLMSNDL